MHPMPLWARQGLKALNGSSGQLVASLNERLKPSFVNVLYATLQKQLETTPQPPGDAGVPLHCMGLS